MFFGVRMISQILNFAFSFFPISALLFLAYRIWERKRTPSGFFHLFVALILTFIASFQTFLLVWFFEYLYDYEATGATIVFCIGLGFALRGIYKISENVSHGEVNFEVKQIYRWLVLIALAFVIVYYIPIYFKVQRTFIWKVGGLFYGLSHILLWGIFNSIAIIAGLVEKLKNQAKILKVLSFYFLIEPLIYLTLVAFEVLPSWLFTARLIMSTISALIALFVVSFTFIFSLKYLNQVVSEVERIYPEGIKLISLRKIRSLVFTSVPFIGILLFLQAFLIKTYIEFEVKRYASEKAKLLQSVANDMEFAIKSSFKILEELAQDKDVAEINLSALHSKYERAFRRFPDYIGNVGRVDENGILRYTYPVDPKAIGRDVSYQEHNRKFLILRKPIVSSVFRAVQGYDAVVLGYPVFDSRGKFLGGVSCLIDVNKMLQHFSKMAGGGLDEFLVFSVNNGSVLFSNQQNLIGQNFYDAIKKLVREDVKSIVQEEINSKNSDGIALQGRHIWWRKINFAFSFAKIELIENDTETWAFVNLIDESTLLERFGYHLRVYFILFVASILIFAYLLWVYINSIKYSFTLEDEIVKQTGEIIESERKYKELAENPLVGLAIYDESGFKFVNRRLCEILGYETIDEFLKLSPFNIIHPDDREKWVERGKKLLRGEFAPERADYRAFKKDGSIVYLTCYSKRVIFDGKPAVQTVIIDSTKERMQENMIRHLQRVESIGTFTMGMAHDFNNILQIIVASAQMIDLKFQRGELKKEDLKKYIDNIISISNRGAELIKRLKIFTRKEIPNAEILDFEQVVLNTVDLLRSLFPKFIDIEVRSNCAGVKVYGSRIEIQQAFLNIAINAKDAIVEKKEKGMLNENGKILIETCVKDITLEDADIFKVNPGKYVCVSVSDNGIGMDEKTKSRIFEPFFTTKRPEIGTGLGMATVFGIVTSHGGFITVDSKLGEGTKVAFYLPVVSIDEIPKVGQKVKEVEKGTGATVMIICENQNLKSKLKSFFESKGVEILFADDKVIAVKVLNENSEKIGTILIDSKTPRLKLKDTIAELKILKPSVKIILLYSTQETSEIEGVEVIENPESEMEKLIELARL